jgi:GT2 family glycosyltransferase
MKKIKVVVIIPNWNLKNDLSECIHSLRASKEIQPGIIVVDNASSDGSVETIRSQFPTIKIIQFPENRGYPAALNAGIRAARATKPDYYFALNNDVIVPPDVLKTLVQVMEENPTIGISTPLVVYHDKPDIIQSLGDKTYPLMPVPIRYGLNDHDQAKYHKIQKFDYVFGCALFIRKEVFETIGLFDASYFMQYEDGDFCRRARDHGWEIARVGTTKILHKVSLSIRKQKPLMIYYQARNRAIFFRRYKHGIHPVFTFLFLLAGSCAEVVKFLLRKSPELINPYVRGSIAGLFNALPHPEGTEL